MEHELSEVARLAVKYVNTTRRNIFLTGKAGTGKTTLLRYIIENTYKNAVVAAPTGIAAINAGGVTLHSLLQLPFGTFIPEDIPMDFAVSQKVNTPYSVVSGLEMGAAKRDLLKEMELLIIDEVSMLRADLLDCIDVILRHVRRRKDSPFGGVQLLFIGDLNQLPPVVKNNEIPLLSQFYKSVYFFDSHVLQASAPVFVELDKIYRQEDYQFIEILNRLRDNKLNPEDVRRLNTHYQKDFSPAPEEGFIHITTHNRKSDIINRKELEKLSSAPFNYHAEVSGLFPEHMFPLTESVTFKEGAQVMFIKNDPSGEGKFYNGKIGRIVELGDNSIKVKLNDPEKVVEVSKYLWENKRYKVNKESNMVEEEVIGSFEQYPLKLAWAITVHKSQGLTFDKAILDLTDSFAPGQMYVALSRLTSLQGLVLSTPVPSTGIKIDEALSDFAKTKKDFDSLRKDLLSDRREFLVNYAENAFSLVQIQTDMKGHLKSFDKDENRSVKQKYHSNTIELFQEINELQDVTEKFIRQLRRIQHFAADSDYLLQLQERITKAEAYFLPRIQELRNKISRIKNELGKKPQVKTYAGELKEFEDSLKKQVQRMNKAALLINYAVDDKTPVKEDLYKSIDKGKGAKKGKKAKGHTREISYELFKGGMGIEEIALSRGLTEATIEGHLSAYVEKGELDVSQFIKEEKINQVLTVVGMLNTDKLSEIKQRLGDDFSYGDIKMAVAYQKFTQTVQPDGANK